MEHLRECFINYIRLTSEPKSGDEMSLSVDQVLCPKRGIHAKNERSDSPSPLAVENARYEFVAEIRETTTYLHSISHGLQSSHEMHDNNMLRS